ncbi:DNA-binding NarL/FixJ family response regulator [Caulobacter ginsengisoli]|uniref:DNA-binding NarL/FixJ family response regulator n=1 Tax=Caulobacter ginsengisoli TaxID=400775 RepID=A0ABU0IXT5_9CAUL|nr:response regulator transcription factor [Caulobacter ginsengisoli]MDQ0466003.1 DNA-binding NarL/FixJ family response regulator [Caulobacter ginsengisoli]
MWRTVAIYGLILALGAVGLQWLEYQTFARAHPGAIYLTLGGAAMLALGVWVGAQVFRPKITGVFEPNLKAQASLGITSREFEVLGLLAAGCSNKDIARRLDLSPNTVKTHVARLYEKLEAQRRTEAVLRARELHLIP